MTRRWRIVRPDRSAHTIIALALLALLLVAGLAPAAAGAASCPGMDAILVPGAETQKLACLDDLTTAGTVASGHTNPADWTGLHAPGTVNPTGVPGIQVDGYFPDTSTTNANNGWNHDAQFVIRLPAQWNGKLVITGAPGVRGQYANDFIIGDWVLARGYAFASTDKGNTGVFFFRDGQAPGDAIAEWNRRVRELTVATKDVLHRYYGKKPSETYIAGISNGAYLVRYALEHDQELYSGGVDWEGTLFRADGPNLLTYLPAALKNYPAAAGGNPAAFQAIVDAGFAPDSAFLWGFHYAFYWDVTLRSYREEFDPDFDGALEAGVTPTCSITTVGCAADVDYDYFSRPASVRDALANVELTGKIKRPLISLHGDLDTLLPIRLHGDAYAALVQGQNRELQHRYYTIEDGNHIDAFYPFFPTLLRPVLPCFRTAFADLEGWVEQQSDPPASGVVPRPASGDLLNSCSL
jgi:hypothetical protein